MAAKKSGRSNAPAARNKARPGTPVLPVGPARAEFVPPGRRLRDRLARGFLPLPGAFNAVTGMIAQQAGFEALYVSGSGTATGDFGLPDLGLTTLTEMAEAARRIASATGLPVLADADMGFGGPVHVARTVREFEAAGVAGIHIEDQSFPKRCGHLDGKMLIPPEAMAAKIEAAAAARRDDSFYLVARCDAKAVEGLDAMIARCTLYARAGADMIFAEALADAAEFRRIAAALAPLDVPVMANMTEFGKSALLTAADLEKAGVAAVIWPLTAFRMMLQAAQDAYRELARTGTQKELLPRMMTRQTMYDLIGYAAIEQRIREGQTP
ncbi:MAG: methylisocitrate lyase [Planctomycetota bacterium]